MICTIHFLPKRHKEEVKSVLFLSIFCHNYFIQCKGKEKIVKKRKNNEWMVKYCITVC